MVDIKQYQIYFKVGWKASNHNDVMFYKLRASTGDSSEVSAVNDGNYYYTTANNLILIIFMIIKEFLDMTHH